ncbi:molybdopterin-guanine dinucleotide biosynthesis protein B [Chloroflexota bacterium]
MAAIVSIVSSAKAGKTTLIEKLIPELKARGYRVATVKHAPQGTTLDEPDRDSARHLQAGSEITALASKDKLLLIKPVAEDKVLDEIPRLLGEDYDIVLAEGFKQGDAPKIEVHRKEAGPPLKNIKKLSAIATDEPLETKTRQFSLEDIKGLADFIEQGFIRPGPDRLSLYINDEPIPLSMFPKDIVTNVLLAMANSLKGVKKVKSLKAFLVKKD